jgi:3-isopropylmalate/(R)-2-methylmalate dehydratase small subunit
LDLEAQELRRDAAAPVPFTVEPFARRCLLDGVDTLGWLQSHAPAIAAFEAVREPETAA